MNTQSVSVAGQEMAHLIMVLLVDDQPLVAEILRREIGDGHGISFHYCQDPFEAVRTAEEIGPAVILLDITMPGLDGFTVCKFLRANPATRDIPFNFNKE